jgi:hypothetical protein
MRVTIDVTVHDKEALFEAALARAQEDGMSPEDCEQFGLKDEDGNIQEGPCLQMLLDPGESPPGCEIEYSEYDSES